MTLQDSLNRIEELLRALKDRDARAQKAWEAITMPCALVNNTHRHNDNVGDVVPGTCKYRYLLPFFNMLPEGAIRGLLLLHVASELSLWRPSVVCQEFFTPAAEIAAALIAALETKEHTTIGEGRHVTDC